MNSDSPQETLRNLLISQPNITRRAIRNNLNKVNTIAFNNKKRRRERIRSLKALHSVGNSALNVLTGEEKIHLNQILEIEKLSDEFERLTKQNFRAARKTNKYLVTQLVKNTKKENALQMLRSKFPSVKNTLRQNIATAKGTIEQLKDAIRIAKEGKD